MPSDRRLRTLITLVLVLLAGMLVERSLAGIAEALGIPTVLAGDPTVYERRWEAIASGQVPYFDTVFEHFPLNILPLAVAGMLTNLGLNYTSAWAIVASVLVGACAWVVHEVAKEMGDRHVYARFLLLLTPLIPLVLFRNDILALLLAALAYLAWISRRGVVFIAAAIAGVTAKGWPVVLSFADWWRGYRARSATLTAVTVLLVSGLLATPGFRVGRSFDGVHQETLSGSLLLGWRHITGAPLGVFDSANAVYIDAGSWALVVNLALGGVLAVAALTAMRRPFDERVAATILAALVLSIIIASPLFSAQFLLWPIVFMAVQVERPMIGAFVLASISTVALLGVWDHRALWWAVLLVVRNLLVVGVAATVSYRLASGRYQSTSQPLRSVRG